MPSHDRGSGKRNVVTIDPNLMWERRLHHMEKRSGWAVFRAVYWGIYIFIVGVMILEIGAGAVAPTASIGLAVVILALFVIIYGFVISLHYSFLKKHG